MLIGDHAEQNRLKGAPQSLREAAKSGNSNCRRRVFLNVVNHGGFAEYFGVEPTVFRLAIVFLIVATGIVPGIATYVVAVLIMPKGPDEVPDAPPTARRKTGSGDGERKSRNTETGPEKTADDEETDGGEQPRTPRE